MVKKKALILVQGIADDLYIKKSVKASKFDLSPYGEVIQFTESEAVFDAVDAPFWIPKKYKDEAKDLWGFFKNKTARKIIKNKLEKTIDVLKKDGYKVDILAHSLGCLIALLPERRINKLFVFDSPVGFEFDLVRWYINTNIIFRAKLQTLSTVNVWGTHFVARDMQGAPEKIYKKRTRYYKGINVDSDHSIKNLINAFLR